MTLRMNRFTLAALAALLFKAVPSALAAYTIAVAPVGGSTVSTSSTTATAVPFEVFVTGSGAASLGGFNVGLVLTPAGTFSGTVTNPSAHPALYDSGSKAMFLSASAQANTLSTFGYFTAANAQATLADNAGLFRGTLILPAGANGLYGLSFDTSSTYAFDGGGNDLSLTVPGGSTQFAAVVPEPTAFAAMALCFFACQRRRFAAQ